MAADDFFSRWSRRKTALAAGVAPEALVVSTAPNAPLSSPAGAEAAGLPQPLPTQVDVDQLTKDSDYSAFVADGVDETVKRSAMKKLFANPHFNIMDGLDIYIDDYSKPDPIPAAMLAALNHGKALLDPLSQLRQPMMSLVETVPPTLTETIVAPTDSMVPIPDQLSDEVQEADAAPPPTESADVPLQTATAPTAEPEAAAEGSDTNDTTQAVIPPAATSHTGRS